MIKANKLKINFHNTVELMIIVLSTNKKTTGNIFINICVFHEECNLIEMN